MSSTSSSKRVTLAANNKQTNKSIILLPSSITDTHRFLLDSATKKLRIKKPSRIFVSGGRELTSSTDYNSVLKNDITLLISSGEDYVGNITHNAAVTGLNTLNNDNDDNNKNDQPEGIATTTTELPTCQVRVIATDAPIEPTAVKQLHVAAKLPGMLHAVGQPDLHQGTKFPIGAAFVSKDWISPPLIGGDIGCGINWYRTTLKDHVVSSNPKKIAERLKGLEGPWLTKRERDWWLGEDTTGDDDGGEGFDESIGTIGKGNHFAEIQVVEEVEEYVYPGEDEKTYRPPFVRGEVVLLVHSGSRGFGQHVLGKQKKESIRADSDEAVAYLKLHDKACRWARKNRDLIAFRFLQKLEGGGGEWEFDMNEDEEGQQSQAKLETMIRKIQSRKVMDIWHNNVEKILWPPHPPSTTASPPLEDEAKSEQYPVYIHRKGAAPATPSIPFLPLPGSRGTPTLILHPIFTSSTGYGVHNLLSVAHGAGRNMSRSKALNLSKKYRDNITEMTQKGGDGGWVICDDKALVWEEAPEAYKDVITVGEDMVKEGVCVIVGMMRPRVTYKVRHE